MKILNDELKKLKALKGFQQKEPKQFKLILRRKTNQNTKTFKFVFRGEKSTTAIKEALRYELIASCRVATNAKKLKMLRIFFTLFALVFMGLCPIPHLFIYHYVKI